MSDWWTDGAMVNSGLPGDEGFVGDAATEADAQRVVDAHNDARIQEPAAGPPWFPEAGDKAEAPHSLDGVTALDGNPVTPEDVAYVRRMQAEKARHE